MPSGSSKPFVWSRKHTIAAATTAVVVIGGVGTAAALRAEDPEPVVAPPPVASSTTPTPAPAKPTPKPAPPKPDPVDALTGGKPSKNGVFAVKVENIAAARPQVGLGRADIVFVEEVEAQLTRLVAVYHTEFPRRVGPVRSARNTDVELLAMFGRPALVYSGANRRVQRNIDRSDIKPVQRSTRDPGRVAPHNVIVDLKGIASSAKVRAPSSIGWTFAKTDERWSKADKDGEAAGRVGADRLSFDYSGGRYVVRWNARTYQDSSPAKTDNVVIMSVENRQDGNADVNGSASVKSSTVGKGKVTVYRDGRRLSGTWKRSGDDDPMRLLDAQGRDIPLKPGQTWVLLSG